MANAKRRASDLLRRNKMAERKHEELGRQALRARTPRETDWARIAALYDALAQVAPSPAVELNRAAVSEWPVERQA